MQFSTVEPFCTKDASILDVQCGEKVPKATNENLNPIKWARFLTCVPCDYVTWRVHVSYTELFIIVNMSRESANKAVPGPSGAASSSTPDCYFAYGVPDTAEALMNSLSVWT